MRAGLAAAFAAGALFGLGLAVSGMADRSIVLGFLDLTGDFNPQLAFVLVSAVGVTALAYRFVLRLPRPLFDPAFRMPAADAIDQPLLIGAMIFGIGWGLAGFCPGPALVGLAGGVTDAVIFVPAMLAGSFLHWLYQRGLARP